MSSPQLFILLPAIAGLILLFFRRYERAVLIGGVSVSVLIGLVAWVFPVGEPIIYGAILFRIESQFSLFGQTLVLANNLRWLVSLFYFGAALWFSGAFVARPGKLFVPLGMLIIALVVGAFVVRPFLFAAGFISLAVILSIPLISPPGRHIPKGVLRYLVFQMLGVPFILFAGWMLTGINVGPAELAVVTRPAALMGIGFALLLAIFPFNTWITMMSEDVHPYLLAFLYLFLPGAVMIFGYTFFDRFAWLRASESVLTMLRFVGTIMLVTAGTWAAFQRHLGRIFAFAVQYEIGLSLLAIGLGSPSSVAIFFGLAIPRALSFFLWSMALTIMVRKFGGMAFSQIADQGRKHPFVLLGLIIAQFSVVGVPLLAGFPFRWPLLQELARNHFDAAFAMLFGSVGLAVSGFRTLSVMVGNAEPASPDDEEVPRAQRLPEVSALVLLLGSILLLLIGLRPDIFTVLLVRLPLMFPQIIGAN